jgi:hypothetical protein
VPFLEFDLNMEECRLIENAFEHLLKTMLPNVGPEAGLPQQQGLSIEANEANENAEDDDNDEDFLEETAAMRKVMQQSLLEQTASSAEHEKPLTQWSSAHFASHFPGSIILQVLIASLPQQSVPRVPSGKCIVYCCC